MPQPPRLFDRALLRRRLARAAPDFARADFLARAAAEDLVERLESTPRRFVVAVDLAARRGAFAAALAASPAGKRVGFLIEADLAGAMLAGRPAQARPGARLLADEERLPLAAGGVDLVVSALSLHWANDLVGALIQIRRALRPDGLFLGALLGGETLIELRSVLLDAELEVAGGAGPRVSPMAQAGEMGALMQRAGFALPVGWTWIASPVSYGGVRALLADLRAMGQTSVLFERPARPLTRPVLARAEALYQARHGEAGRIPATFQIIALTGWAPPQPADAAEARFGQRRGWPTPWAARRSAGRR